MATNTTVSMESAVAMSIEQGGTVHLYVAALGEAWSQIDKRNDCASNMTVDMQGRQSLEVWANNGKWQVVFHVKAQPARYAGTGERVSDE